MTVCFLWALKCWQQNPRRLIILHLVYMLSNETKHGLWITFRLVTVVPLNTKVIINDHYIQCHFYMTFDFHVCLGKRLLPPSEITFFCSGAVYEWCVRRSCQFIIMYIDGQLIKSNWVSIWTWQEEKNYSERRVLGDDYNIRTPHHKGYQNSTEYDKEEGLMA